MHAAAEASDIVVACVSTYTVFDELFKPVSGALKGRALVNLTTGTPGESRRTAGWASAAGIDYLSGAIMATPSLIGRPETLIVLRTAGVSAVQFLPYVDEWLKHVIVPSLTDPVDAEALNRLDFQTSESNLAVNRWAIELILRSSLEAGGSPDWLVPIHRLASRKVKEGFGADSFTRVFEALVAAAPADEEVRG